MKAVLTFRPRSCWVQMRKRHPHLQRSPLLAILTWCFRIRRRCREGVGVGDGLGMKLTDTEPRFMSGVEAFMSLVNLASTQHTFRAGHVIYTPHFLFVYWQHSVNFWKNHRREINGMYRLCINIPCTPAMLLLHTENHHLWHKLCGWLIKTKVVQVHCLLI